MRTPSSFGSSREPAHFNRDGNAVIKQVVEDKKEQAGGRGHDAEKNKAGDARLE